MNAASLADPAAYKNPDKVRSLLKTLRDTAPISFVSPSGYRPFWAISKYKDIRYVESNPLIFSAEPRTVLVKEDLEKENFERFGNIHGVKTLVHMDGEQHRKLRNVTSSWFMPKNIALLKGKVDIIASDFVDRLNRFNGECDFAADFAFWYPLRVILQLIGVPECDEPKILRLTQQLFAPESFVNKDQNVAAIFGETVDEMVEYFTALAALRRSIPRNDIATVIANAEIDGEAMHPFTLTSYFVILATAGHDTTSASLAGGLHSLIQNPDQHQLLLNNPDLYPKFIDETIRWTSPVKHFLRTALVDTEISGVSIAKGDSLALFFESGNRDEEYFQDPDRFDISRVNNRHIAFGFGRHNCLGLHLSKMELLSIFRRIVPIMDKLELTSEPKYIESNFVSGLSSLPIRYILTS
jgi:cytochrome P450